MKKTITTLVAAATIAGTLAMAATDASAQYRHGWGWGPGAALGILGGAIVAGAILATRPPGYVVYRGYDRPLSRGGCYWAGQPVYDARGRIIGWQGEPVQVCP